MSASILEGIKTDPADELAWLALADWLEEDNQPEPAELHRLSLPLRRPHLDHRASLEDRLRQLLASGVRPVVPVETVRLGKGVELKLALIPPGSFLMGSPKGESGRSENEGPVHRVTLTRGFYLGIYPITQAQWQQLMGDDPSYIRGDDRPVHAVSWDDCLALCGKLSHRTGRRFRLPSEAEWEYACRAGTTTPFHVGNTLSARQANYNGCFTYGRGRKGTFRQHTMSVGSFSPNAFGLFDMHGNIWEWCQDAFADAFYRESSLCDPRCYGAGGNQRVIRGGCWFDPPSRCRSACRGAAGGSGAVGCRVVLELGD